MKRTRPGLTRVEVLAALVLLAVISSIAWSFLRDIRLQLEAAVPSGIDRAELGVAADAVLKGEAFASVLRLAAGETLTVAWPDQITSSSASRGVDRSNVMTPETTQRMLHLRRLAESSSITPGCWVACTADVEATVVYRWIPLPIDVPAANPESPDADHRP